MERFSALMDGELEAQEADAELNRLKGDPEGLEAWETFHLIGDALRGQGGLAADVLPRVAARLAGEPTVLAPRRRKPLASPRRLALSLAATVCGIAVVAWLALNQGGYVDEPRGESLLADAGQQAQVNAPVQVAGAPVGNNAAVNDYLIAHQEFSPSTAMQGMVSYVRTVSARDMAR